MARKIKRTFKKLTPRESRAYDALVDRIEAERPVLRKWAATGFAMDRRLRELMQTLKAARESQGISLTELARRTGIAKGNLSKLENDSKANPTLETVMRYARGIDAHVNISVSPSTHPKAPGRKAG